MLSGINNFVNKKKKLICGLIVFFFISVFTFFEMLSLYLKNITNIGMIKGYLLIFAFSVIFLFCTYVRINLVEVKTEKLFLYTMIFCAGLYMIIFPAFSVPDEPVHFFSAYRISNFLMLKPSQLFSKKFLIRESDLAYYLSGKTSLNRDMYLDITSRFSIFELNNETTEFECKIVTSAPFAYIPASIGITLARICHLSTVVTIFLGRAFNAITCILLGYFSTKIIPYGKTAVLAIFALPMSLHLICSYSYDGIIIALSVYLVSQILYLKEKKTKATKKELIALLITIILFSPMKIVYFPLVLLVFMIPSENLSVLPKKATWIKIVLILASGVSLLALQSLNIFSGVSQTEAINYSGEGINYSTSWVLKNIPETILICLRTFEKQFDWYFKTFFGYSLGWFQITVPAFFIIPFIIMFFISFLKRKGEVRSFGICEKICFIIIAAVISAMVVFVLLVSWTKLGNDVIEGIQGRYFLPIAVLLFLIIRNDSIVVNPKIDKYMYLLFALQNYIVITEFFGKIMIQ